MYRIEKEENYVIYIFNGIDLRVKVVNKGLLSNVYIKYDGYNPLFSMLLGNFEEECEIDALYFEIERIENYGTEAYYFIIDKDCEESFIKEIYFFIMEDMGKNFKFNESDKAIWDF